jgi:hypothetical protein
VGFEVGTAYTIALPVEAIRAAAIKEMHPVKTSLLIGSLTAVALIGFVGMMGGGSEPSCVTNFDVDVEGSSPRGHCATDGPDGGPIPDGGSNTLTR